MLTPAITCYGSETQQAELRGKFLQLIWRGREYLVFAPFGVHRYHNQILAHFLQEHAIEHRWLGEERLDFNHPDLDVVGGGRFLADTQQHILELWDNSQVYGRFDDQQLVEKIAASAHPWSDFSITIS